MPAKKSAPRKPMKKSVEKSPTKVAAKKPVKKKPHLKLVPKPESRVTAKKKKESVGDVFRRLLEQKELRRKEQNPHWFEEKHGSRSNRFHNQAQFSRFNGPRRKAA